jgi:hypothetical protein
MNCNCTNCTYVGLPVMGRVCDCGLVMGALCDYGLLLASYGVTAS